VTTNLTSPNISLIETPKNMISIGETTEFGDTFRVPIINFTLLLVSRKVADKVAPIFISCGLDQTHEINQSIFEAAYEKVVRLNEWLGSVYCMALISANKTLLQISRIQQRLVTTRLNMWHSLGSSLSRSNTTAGNNQIKHVA
jgi:hypothetical protein